MLTSIPDLLKIITPNQRRIDAAQAKLELEQNKKKTQIQNLVNVKSQVIAD